MKIFNHAVLVILIMPFFSPVTPTPPSPPKINTNATNMALKSVDGGKTWQDISEGLPKDWDGMNLFADESGLHVRAGNKLYQHESGSTTSSWKQENFPGGNSNISPGNSGIFAYSWNGAFSQRRNGTNEWSPIFTNLHQALIRTVFETEGGTLFVGSDNGLFRSTDQGKNWKRTFTGGWVIKMVASGGLLLAASQQGIIKSSDNGETWDLVLQEGGVGIDIQPIKGGFAAITFNTRLMYRSVRATYDGGKTWQAIDAGLPADTRTASIIEVGKQFFCGHPAGIFQSSDKGKTWNLMLPSVNDKVFNLFLSGNVIYAIARSGGC